MARRGFVKTPNPNGRFVNFQERVNAKHGTTITNRNASVTTKPEVPALSATTPASKPAAVIPAVSAEVLKQRAAAERKRAADAAEDARLEPYIQAFLKRKKIASTWAKAIHAVGGPAPSNERQSRDPWDIAIARMSGTPVPVAQTQPKDEIQAMWERANKSAVGSIPATSA